MFNLPVSAYILIGANLFPLGMAAGGNWGVREILPLYWFESAIIGFFNILKILMASGPITGRASGRLQQLGEQYSGSSGALSVLLLGGRIFIAAFFTFHFGMFMAVHGVFLFGLVLGGFKTGGAGLDHSLVPVLLGVKWAVLALFLSHGASFFLNFVGSGEFRQASAAECMAQPYSRVVVMHLTILLGAFASALFQNTGPVMVIFVGLKIFTDVKAHMAERRKAAGQAAPPEPSVAPH
ncbi:MAG TPA: hypothetical protein DEQ38_07845 [Elusimicrobia bacterium]|nr:MAG: hypothetical protein A2089_06290 [Elusimicrobia bacterium GWD2_63_28]HCC48008.1 hypothetical protein [Elusimicrobiota bacterium]